MIESIVTISITGFIAGFIFAMPIAGPTSILIVSNALRGRLRYSSLVSLGAGIADFTYIFIAVLGIASLYRYYKPVIPYLFLGGTVFFLFLGYKIFRTKIDLNMLKADTGDVPRTRKSETSGFYTGLMINYFNPTIFIGGLTSSFFVISLIASLGLKTGGLDLRVNENYHEVSVIKGSQANQHKSIPLEALKKIQSEKPPKNDETVYPRYFHLVISFCYALFISIGSISWFHLLSYLLVRFRHKMKLNFIGKMIRVFGVILVILGIYFGYLGAKYLLL